MGARGPPRTGDPPTGKASHFTALAAEYSPVRSALVFVPAWQLPVFHPDLRPHRAGEEKAVLAAAGARGAAGPERPPGLVVLSDSELGLQPVSAQRCIDALIAVSHGYQLVGAARSGLGPANPDEVNAPGGGVTENFGLVRAQDHEALLKLEVESSQVEDRGFQQGWPTSATVYQRRISLAMRLRASFLTLWRRASATVADTDFSPLRDDDGAPVIRDLPDMYTLSVASDLAQLLDELTDTN